MPLERLPCGIDSLWASPPAAARFALVASHDVRGRMMLKVATRCGVQYTTGVSGDPVVIEAMISLFVLSVIREAL